MEGFFGGILLLSDAFVWVLVRLASSVPPAIVAVLLFAFGYVVATVRHK